MNIKLTQKHVFFLLAICFVHSIKAQQKADSNSYKIIRSNLGAGGTSKTMFTSKGSYVVSQSIGQSSVIGTYSNNGYYLRQGYQQPSSSIKVVKKSSTNNLSAVVHPNPFGQSVLISFTESMTKTISVLVYDISGKLIYSRAFPPSKDLDLDLSHISNGSYLLKAISNGKLFNAKLIKI
ncbi:T9SS type A sorting domain-containing protein [Flavivirga amylovorans]|uniref:T9SS type A sorting domain-containing protein n=1 Tax=Flavivirga amylovorans TaxID=870486 RepID=A0ABT8X3U7_9FLAO|nr:T9SS type A sorting domain-containing protein [Flavivirga amylovorans]MDO5988638.1 T9SS type A sorting domain-containing protein [Flavivirga amylovorans]